MEHSEVHAFVDRLGRFFDANGLPRMAGRLMGLLLVCDPPEQTFDELVEDAPPAVQARLQTMREFSVFLEKAYTPILAEWEQRRRQS